MLRFLKLGFLSVALFATATLPVRAVTQAAINNAIDKGAQALRLMQGPTGAWPYAESGATALAGLTLLECGAKTDDKAVQAAADVVRQASLTVTYNYSISLAILFLDRLGDPNDIPLIESLTVRLLAGQTASGGWNYHSPPISDAEIRRLQGKLAGRNELVGRRELPKPGAVKRTPKDLPKEIQLQLATLHRASGMLEEKRCDNSNTQFATLALWVARRYGLPVDAALRRVETRFRSTQHADGGWGYVDPGMGHARWTNTTASMTCAGLLGLAVADGKAAETQQERKPGSKPARDANKDPMLRRGLLALSTAIGHPRDAGGRRAVEAAAIPQVGGRTFYFLWSMERVAVALDLKTIGKKDWYAWGAEILVANQQTNGLWLGNYADSGADTCFALLFLKRANLVPDLTSQLTGRIQDVNERVLKQGGRGGDAIPLEKALASGIEDKNTKPAVEGKYPGALTKNSELRPILDTLQNPPPVEKKPKEPVVIEKKPNENAIVEKPQPEKANVPNPPTSAAARMGAGLAKSTGSSFTLFLQQMREGKGSEFTEALAFAIPQLKGEQQRRAREALVERLKRMKDTTLSEYLADPSVELRRAAALAGAAKGSRSLVPRLIPLLRDTRPLVSESARTALKEMSGQDFGPKADATREERVEASRKWLDWWNKQEQR